MEKNNEGRNSTHINFMFIDFLFTLVIQFGFQNFMESNWIKNGTMPNSKEITSTFVFFLSLVTVILSWYGYHQSISRNEHKNGICEMFKFMIDVILLLIYGIMLNKFDNLEMTIILLICVFTLYMIWDALGSIHENYANADSKNKMNFRRQLITILCLICIILIYIFARNFDDMIRISLLVIVVIFYRIFKILEGSYEKFKNICCRTIFGCHKRNEVG